MTNIYNITVYTGIDDQPNDYTIIAQSSEDAINSFVNSNRELYNFEEMSAIVNDNYIELILY